LGEGSGGFLGECLGRFPDASVTCVDESAAMLRQARRQLARQNLDDPRVCWVTADALTWTPARGEFDLIVTHFFLDCFRADQLRELVPRIAGGAATNASWLIADFQVPRDGWRRVRSRAILALLYAFFRVVTRLPARSLAPPDEYLEGAGFQMTHRVEFEWGLLKSELWRLDGSRRALIPDVSAM
jgi:trans-aconitate methyltransferase